MRVSIAAFLALPLLVLSAMAAEPPKPGQRYQVTPADLPRPNATPSASNPAQTVRA